MQGDNLTVNQEKKFIKPKSMKLKFVLCSHTKGYKFIVSCPIG